MLKKDLIIILTLSAVVLLITWYTSSDHYVYEYPVVPATDSLERQIEVQTSYDFPVDSFDVSRGKIKRNQFLADILTDHNLSYQKIDKLVRNAKNIFDVRRIKVGNRYTVLSSLDSIPTPRYFIYEEGPVDYLVFHLHDSLFVERKQKELISKRKYVKGIIESSLWNAMNEAEANPMLAVELSEIYQWTVDFFGIQKGDAFEVVYDESFVDSVSVGIETIYTASFTHYKEEVKAYRFLQDSVWSYFDEDGVSLRKAFRKSPLRFSRISSGFSNSRLHPVLKIRRPHHGIDYAAPSGTPVHTIGDGVVVKKGYQKKGGGRYVKIKHNSVYTTVYMHFSGFAKGITVGKKVKQGDVIGYVGSSGLATGPHLDFRVYKNGSAINPLRLKSPPVDPVKEENKHTFKAIVEHWQAELKAENDSLAIVEQ
jgi:murein DD-endopeptidase MepM/ murein hydrolase activator NlpD